MKISVLTAIAVLTINLSGCKTNSTTAPNTKSTPILAEFSSSIVGDHPIFTNAIIDNLVSEYPLVAAFPKLVKLKKIGELETFISQSKTVGFDKEQFDILYQATLIVVESIRLELASDLFSDHLEVTPPTIDFQATHKPGYQGKGKQLTYETNQYYSLPDCKKGAEVCDIHIEALVSFNFPIKNPLYGTADGYRELELSGMQINASSFKVSNQYASLDLALNPKTTFTIEVNNLWVEGGTDTLISVETWGNTERPTTSNIKGRFTNQYMDESGNVKRVQITGSMLGDIADMVFAANYNSDEPISQPYTTSQLQEGDFNNIKTLGKGRMSGLMENANLEVNFVTEAVE